MIVQLKNFLTGEEGAGAVEYTLIIALVAAVIAAALGNLQAGISAARNAMGAVLNPGGG